MTIFCVLKRIISLPFLQLNRRHHPAAIVH